MYSGGITRPCANLECRQTTCVMGDCKQKVCAAGARTRVTGRIYDPAGKVPLYNIVVYVPNAPLDPITTGPSCDRCDSPVSGKPITSALTDTKGDFVLDNVPVGDGVPLVIQVGKWRRQITLPAVNACADNPVSDKNLLRLPRNQKEGNIPRIALTTGGYDRLECLLRKIGIEDSEFTPESRHRAGHPLRRQGQPGRPRHGHLRAGAERGRDVHPGGHLLGDARQPHQVRHGGAVVRGGLERRRTRAPRRAQGMIDFANLGGRIFASHWHEVWIQFGPAPWNTIGNFVPAYPSGFMNQLPDLPDMFPTDVDTSFPKGAALAEWLVNVQASMTPGKLPVTQGKHTLLSVNDTVARRWIHSSTIPTDFANPSATGVQYVTFNAPVGAAAGKECGRTVFTDIHLSAGDQAGPPFPTGCVTTDLSPQEKALEFMLFDLSSCIQPDAAPPKPPVIP